MKGYKKIPLQRMVDIYFGKLLNFYLITIKKYFKGKPKKKFKKIVIFRLSSIGDSILLLPAIKNLKEKTNAEIVVVCAKENLSIFLGHKFIDKRIILDNKIINPFKALSVVRKIRKENPDIIIDTTHSSNFSAFFSHLSRGYHIGLSNSSTKIRNQVYHKSIELNKKEHMVFNYLNLIQLLGINYNKKNVRLVSPIYSEKEEKKIEEKIGNSKKIVGIHAVSSPSYKQWPIKNFVELIKYLYSKNYKIVFVGSPSEKSFVERILSKLDEKYLKNIINLAGNTNMKELFYLMKKFSIFVANEGGPMHISVAMGVPTLGLFSCAPKDPLRGLFGFEDKLRYYPFNKNCSYIYEKNIRDIMFSEVKNKMVNLINF